MPLLVKISAIWLFLVVFGAIYAKLDQSVFGGALPLQDPNLQTNNFNAETGDFGTGEPLESPSASATGSAPTPWPATRSPASSTEAGSA